MRWPLFILLLLLAASIALAQPITIEHYNITFSVSEDSVRETVHLTLQNPAERIRFIAKGAYDIATSNSQGPIGFNLLQESGSSVIEAFPKNDTYVEISFSTKEQIIRSGDTFQFFNELSLSQNITALHIDFVLPPGFVIDNHYPQDGSSIKSDGRNIILSWDFENPKTVPLFVRYSSTQPSSLMATGAIVAIIAVAAVGIFYYRRRAKGEFLKGLFEDEGKVVAHLMQNKIAYQNKIEKEFGLSRPKMKRIVYRLEQRGWVKKEKRGRTNKLIWIRGTPEEKKIAKAFESHRKAQEQKKAAEKIMDGGFS